MFRMDTLVCDLGLSPRDPSSESTKAQRCGRSRVRIQLESCISNSVGVVYLKMFCRLDLASEIQPARPE